MLIKLFYARVSASAGNRFRVRDFFLTIRLYDGYDFPTTRQKVFEEIYARRRREAQKSSHNESGMSANFFEGDATSVRVESEFDYEETHTVYSGSAGEPGKWR